MSTFAQIIREHAAQRPQAAALSFEGSTWTFEELHNLSSRAAQALLNEGVKPGDRVALLTKNRAEFYELLLACSKVGAILVGLNWRLAPVELDAIVQDVTIHKSLYMKGLGKGCCRSETLCCVDSIWLRFTCRASYGTYWGLNYGLRWGIRRVVIACWVARRIASLTIR